MKNNIYNAKILENYTLTPITNKLTKSFRKFYDEKLLQETPQSSGLNYGTTLDNWSYNREQAEEYIQFKDTIETLSKFFFGDDISIYDEFENDIHYHYFISLKHRIINGYIYFKLINNRMETCGLWNHRQSKGLIRHLIINYFLPKYKFIVSDSETSTQGQEFWKKIVQYGLIKKHEVGVLYYKENKLLPINELQQINHAWTGLDLGNKRVYIKE